MTLALLFWAAGAVLAYTWIGYPLLLRVLARLARPAVRSRTRRAAWPSLSVTIAAYNEAACIRAKIDSTLGQQYPGRIEVIVVSDGSTDVTDAIVASHPDPRVRLIRQEPRAGKSSALNRGAVAARGDLLVFTDANALFAPDALLRLSAPFADRRVGLVSGQGLYDGLGGGDARAVSGGYVRYEAALKRGEGALGFLASADGAIYALRRQLYRDLAAAEVNDFLHPIHAALAGFQSRFEPRACTVEPPSHDGGQEFRRHTRIAAQGMHLLRRWLPSLVVARRWRAVWMLISHRALRWLNAPALAVLLVASAGLASRAPIYAIALAGQTLFYALALAGWLAERAGRGLGRLAIPYYFCLVSAAGVAGFVRFVRGRAEAVWAPTGQIAERAA